MDRYENANMAARYEREIPEGYEARIDGNKVIIELKQSDDERIRKFLVKHVSEWIGCIEHDLKISSNDVESEEELVMFKAGLAYLEKQKEQQPVHTAKEMWKEMRLEVYAQASGNRHEPNYSDDSTKMFSLCDIDEIFEKIGNSTVGSRPAENGTRTKIISRATNEKQVVLLSESNGNAEIDWDTRSLEDAKRLLEYGLAFIKDLRLSKNNINSAEKQKPAEDWREKRKKECPFRRNLDNNLYGCERYAGGCGLCACDGKCSWVVDYPKLKEIQDKRERKPSEVEQLAKLRKMTHEIREAYERGIEVGRAESEPAEWSEEDEKMLNAFLHKVEVCDLLTNKENVWIVKKLKSLRPKPHTVSVKNATKFANLEYERGVKDGIQSEKSRQWKPTALQQQAIRTAIAVLAEERSFPKAAAQLESLYSCLQKLL